MQMMIDAFTLHFLGLVTHYPNAEMHCILLVIGVPCCSSDSLKVPASKSKGLSDRSRRLSDRLMALWLHPEDN